MIKAFPKKQELGTTKAPETPNDKRGAVKAARGCGTLCDKVAAWWTDRELADRKKKAPVAPMAPAGKGPVQPAATRPQGGPPPKNPMQPDARAKMQQQLEMKKWQQQHMKALAEAMTSLQKTVNVVMNSPMTKSDKTLVSFLNNYGALLNPQNIMKNPQAIGELQAATNELAKEFGAFSARWSGAAQKGQAFLAQAVQEIARFNQTLGMIAGGPPKGAPAAPAGQPMSEFSNPAWNG